MTDVLNYNKERILMLHKKENLDKSSFFKLYKIKALKNIYMNQNITKPSKSH